MNILKRAGDTAAGVFGLVLIALFNMVAIVLPLVVTGSLLYAGWRFLFG